MTDALVPASRTEFFGSYATDPAAAGFSEFLFGRPVAVPPGPDFSNAHTSSLASFAALQSGDRALFQKAYAELSRRLPRAESPWLLNDPLIYGLVLGAVRFGGDRSWIESTLRFRVQHSTGEPHDAASTFLDILAENWKSEANMRPLVLVSRYLLGLDTDDPGLLNSVYQTLVETPFPYFESSFLNAIYIRSFDIVVLSKVPEDPQRKKALAVLSDSVWKWSESIGWIVWLTGLIAIAEIAAVFVLWVRGLASGDAKQWIETLSNVGAPLFTLFPFWPWIKMRKRIMARARRWAAKDFGFDPVVLGYSTDDEVRPPT